MIKKALLGLICHISLKAKKGKKSAVIETGSHLQTSVPSNPIIKTGVHFTVKRYGEALSRLANE